MKQTPITILDAGNTHIKSHHLPLKGGLPDWSEGFVPESRPLPAERDILRWETREVLAEPENLWRALSCGDPVLVSVIPEFTQLFERRYPRGVVVGRWQDLPYEHTLENPHSVGPDRWINVAAAVGAGLRDALVVDVGTATTVDLLRDGVFRGGLIAPGMAFAARQLTEQGAMLPDISFGPEPADVGRNTDQALRRGVWLAGVGGVESMLSRLMQKHGPLPVILTGGLGHHLVGEGRHHDALWTARGAAWWAALR